MSLVAISTRREDARSANFARGLATSRRDLQSHFWSLQTNVPTTTLFPQKLWRDKITTKTIKIDQRIARNWVRLVCITDGRIGVTGD
jgi:hypothetical protein